MALEAFDADVVTAEEFPLLGRLHGLVSRGYALDDLMAGTMYVQPRLDGLYSNELQKLIDECKQYDLAIELCALFARWVEEPAAKFLFVANQGHAEDKLGNTERGRELCLEALAIVEATDDEWALDYRAWSYNQLAWSDFTRGEFDSGADWARKSIEAKPEMWNAYGTLGSCLYELGDDQAYEAFETAMENGVDPEQPFRLRDDERYQALADKYDIPLPQES